MDLSQQADDVLDLFDWMDIQKGTHTQQLGEYDWSSGHSKAQDGGLNPLAFNKGVGGKQTKMRPSHLDHPACVGKEEAVLYRSKEDLNLWSRLPMAGYQEIDCRVYENDTHHSVFRDGDPPPFLDLKRRPNEDWTETITTAKRARGGNAPVVKVTEIVHKAYVGECKGSDQYLWERGLWFDKKETPAGTMASMVMTVPKQDKHERTEEWSQLHIIANLHDFENEQSALEKKYIDRGEIPFFCAKGHPELAGKGVEFCWGVSKRNFRKINDCVGKNLHRNILKSFEVLDIETVRRCSRRTRRYRAAYEAGAGTRSYEQVEKFVAEHKCHRNIFDQETKWIKAELAKHGIEVSS